MASDESSVDLGDVEAQWADFKVKHNKAYDTEEEEAKRKEIFVKTLKDIAAHNKLHEKGEVTWTKGVNQFADLTPDEFKKQCCGYRPPKKD